jgi:hypothetical protein
MNPGHRQPQDATRNEMHEDSDGYHVNMLELLPDYLPAERP